MNEQIEQADTVLMDSLGESWGVFVQHMSLFILAGLVHSALSLLTLGILGGPLTVGLIDMVRAARAGEKVEVTDIFQGFEQFGASFVAALVVSFLVFLGFLLLVVPGLILLAGFLFTFQAIALERLGPGAAMRRSWDLFKDNVPFVVVVSVLAIVLNSVGSAVVFGWVVTGPFTIIFLTILYQNMVGLQLESPERREDSSAVS